MDNPCLRAFVCPPSLPTPRACWPTRCVDCGRYVPQFDTLWRELTVEDHLRLFGALLRKMPKICTVDVALTMSLLAPATLVFNTNPKYNIDGYSSDTDRVKG